MERWKELEYGEFKFIVSDQGRVKRPARTITKTRTRLGKTQTFESFEPEKILAPQSAGKRGYKEVSIMVDGRRNRFAIHRLVGKAFCEGYEEGLHIDHINGDKADNRACNLEWVTNEENVRRAWKNGAHAGLVGENHPVAILSQKQVIIIRRLLRQGVSAGALAALLDVSPETIRKIATGVAWKHVA